MSKRITLATTLLVALAGAYVYGQQFGKEPVKLDLVKVQDDLYVIHNDFVPGNTTALITNDGVLLVDDKYEVDYANVVAQLRKVTKAPIRYVVNTHYHGDHSGSNAKMQALGARVVSSEKARERLLAGKQPGPADLTFDERMRIRLGGKRVDLFYRGRGHTDGDIVAYFPQHHVLAAGDLFAFGDATPELIDYAGGGSALEWPGTLDKVLQLDFDVVVPGHGVVTTKEEMQRFRTSTQTLVNRVREMKTQKKSRDEIEQMLRKEFKWADLHVQMGLDGVIKEVQ
ncbi:MAG TPA: MBL fold metallo-hydrolase [Vicinamibacterales bacterium]|nr:MBL fold metallo-hydrolase [Vicinamibacterales bacterium]